MSAAAGTDIRRRLAIAFVALLGIAYVMVPIPARAISCSGDTWADIPNGYYTGHWYDNYVVGTGCDLHGEYTVGIQRINTGLGFDNSTVDGYYGTNTKNDIKGFQSWVGEAVDGIVGSDTWDAYDNQLVSDGWDGTWLYYKTAGYDRSWFQHTGLSPDMWYSRKLNTSTTWVYFSTSGPA